MRDDPKKIFVMNTMFNLAETCLLSQTLGHYESCPGAAVTKAGVSVGGKLRTFENIFRVSHIINFARIELSNAGYSSSYR